eukprot:CAMPEP_0170507906 /NCGR_PEP_ID=MMETSP0208-20121228/60553_1 /TAXON_ID=197538 /ORGANISM="Strombidium inclinatum, Strain S3" /LENGTH=66 /DNA_ID=CAMNT_0010790453 /DNA_START=331 /DNA_END=531 /DNA_ORIENTATION=+
MFEAAVKSGSPIEIKVKGKQRNGIVLGNEGALFLAKFLLDLEEMYNSHSSGTPGGKLNPAPYLLAL